MERCMECCEDFIPKDSKALNNNHFCSRKCEFDWECENEEEDE